VITGERWRRGDVIRVRLDQVEGSEQGGERPGLVVSPDLINEHSPVILVAAITSRKTEKVYPFEALVEPPEGGLGQRSKVLLMQLRALDKRRIVGKYGTLGPGTLERVDAALRIAVGLTRL
jgi:mRNA interferase MazF